MNFDVSVDSDSVPVNLRLIILKAVSRLSLSCTFVADRTLADVKRFIADDTCLIRRKALEAGMAEASEIRRFRSKISMKVVETGTDSADNYIVENACEKSLCITHDIPLAARLLEKGCTVIDDRGSEYTDSDIKVRLGDRLVNQELRSWGVYALQQSKMGKENRKAFADSLDRTLTRMIRK